MARCAAVVTVADDGGSSGRLRRELGCLPPGDLRMALAASRELIQFYWDLGALIAHITGGHLESESYSGARSFQPMNVNFGLFPEVSIVKPEGVRWRGPDKTIAKRKAITTRALEDLKAWA